MSTDTFPEFDIDDFTRLKIDHIPAHRVSAYIDHCLTDKEYRELSMNHYGSYILGASKNLLYWSGDLLNQLGALTDFIDPPTDNQIDWAELKRQERANNLRIWWEKKRQRKELMRSLAKLYPKGTGTETDIQDVEVISELASHFSPQSEKKGDFNKQLQEIASAGFGNLLPWRHIIIKQILAGTDTFTKLKPVIQDKKKDTALRFQFLTELRHHQYIDIDQKDPFGEIRITPKNEFNPDVTIKDQTGSQMTMDWLGASDKKRKLALRYLKEKKIVMIHKKIE
jgi:hypothetical protein